LAVARAGLDLVLSVAGFRFDKLVCSLFDAIAESAFVKFLR